MGGKKFTWEFFVQMTFFWEEERGGGVIISFMFFFANKEYNSTLNGSIFKKYVRCGKIFSSAWIWDQPQVSSSKGVEMVVKRRQT